MESFAVGEFFYWVGGNLTGSDLDHLKLFQS